MRIGTPGAADAIVAAFVLDASVAIAWVLPEPHSLEARPSLAQALAEGVVVPVVWALEVTNVLLRRERRGQLLREERRAALAVLAQVRIAVDTASAALTFGAAEALAERHGLTTYDAAYLGLATRLALPLATLDSELRKAAAAERVTLLPA